MLDLTPHERALVLRLLGDRLSGIDVRGFGSRVGGWPFGRGAKPYSDLDLAVCGDVDDLALAELRADFEDSDLPFRVDLVRASELPVALAALVQQRGPLLQAAGEPAERDVLAHA